MTSTCRHNDGNMTRFFSSSGWNSYKRKLGKLDGFHRIRIRSKQLESGLVFNYENVIYLRAVEMDHRQRSSKAMARIFRAVYCEVLRHYNSDQHPCSRNVSM